jgi:hypothetical protein
MKRCLALLSLMTGCATASRPVVVLVSIRGLGYDELVGFSAPRDGFMAAATTRPLRPVAVAETAPEMATFETGAEPSGHGIEGSFAMDQRFRTEAVWETAARSGLRVARIGSLFLEGSQPLPSGVRSLPQCEPLSSARHVDLAPGDAVAEPAFERARRLAETPSSRDRLEGLRAFAIDKDRDGAERFAAVVLDDDDDLQNGWLGMAPSGSWMGIELGRRGAARTGTWIKVIALSRDGRATLYVRPTFASRGHPDDFVRDVEAKLGFCPGAPDIDAFRAGRIDSATLGEEIMRESDYVVTSARIALATKPDLVVLDIPRLDRIGHAFGPQGAAVDIRRAAIADTDRDLAALRRAVGASGSIVASSGYSFFAAHTKIAIGRLLRDAQIRFDELKVGTVAAIVRGEPRVVTAVTELVDPKSGQHPLFTEPIAAGLFRVRARPGYTLSPSPEDPLFAAPRFAGEHGYAEGAGVLLYRGPGTLSPGTTLAADVAVTAAALLGIAAPRGSTGSNRSR